MTSDQLPPLPEPAVWREDDGEWLYYDETSHPGLLEHIKRHQKERHGVSIFPLYTADQLRERDAMWADQLRAAVLQERERCARICESVNNYDNPMTANDCAEAIRKGE